METAMCMIEANQPVLLLDIVHSMRDQRAMLIQTSVRINLLNTSVYALVLYALQRAILIQTSVRISLLNT